MRFSRVCRTRPRLGMRINCPLYLLSNEVKMDCVFCGKKVDSSTHIYYPSTIGSNGKHGAAHLGCYASDEPIDAPDATDLRFTLEPLVWSYSEIVVGCAIDMFIRRYTPDMFCWVASFDDGYADVVWSKSGVERSLEDALREAKGFVFGHLLYP